jgi:hypothetical protein
MGHVRVGALADRTATAEQRAIGVSGRILDERAR